MNNFLLILILIVLCFISFKLGKKFYKDTHDGKFQDNVITMMNNMRNDLNSVEKQLYSDRKLEDSLKQKLIERREKIISDLNLFYGKKVY